MAAKRTTKRTKAPEDGNGHGNGHESPAGPQVYETAVAEMKSVGGSDSERRRVEQGPLKEGRGNDVMRLHTTLKAVDAAHQNLWQEVHASRDAAMEQAQTILATLDASFNKTWSTGESSFKKTWNSLDSSFEKTQEQMQGGFRRNHDQMERAFDKTWESLGSNFEATNERTKREIHDLREELTKVLDKRFTQVDQTFASIRADIEVLKALQMELIKERIGRPDIRKS
jgi:DNA anti-recombination protein RmuC